MLPLHLFRQRSPSLFELLRAIPPYNALQARFKLAYVAMATVRTGRSLEPVRFRPYRVVGTTPSAILHVLDCPVLIIFADLSNGAGSVELNEWPAAFGTCQKGEAIQSSFKRRGWCGSHHDNDKRHGDDSLACNTY